MAQAELLADVNNAIGESPVWLETSETLFWVDAELHHVFWRRAVDGEVGSKSLSVPVTALIPRKQGGWILVTQDGLYSASADFSSVALVVDPSAHDPGTRLNDGVADRWGRVWTGSMSRKAVEEPIGRLYLVSAESQVVEVDEGFAVANGVAMSPDGTRAYVSDMFHRRIRVYSLDPDSGEIIRRLPAIPTQGPGYPDGLTVDSAGLLWVSYWDGARVEQLDAAGSVIATVTVPVDQVTRCCLGGRSGSQLFATTGRYDLDDALLQRQPLAGAVFTADVNAVGVRPVEAHL